MTKKYSKNKKGRPFVQTRITGKTDIETYEEISDLISDGYTKGTPAAVVSLLLKAYRDDRVTLIK